MEPAELDALVQQAQRREAAALEKLVDYFGPRVHGFLLRICGAPDVADDLLQETFVRLVRTIDAYQHDGRFAAWLYRVAANLARDHLRRKRRRGLVVTLDRIGVEDGFATDPEPVDARLERPDELLSGRDDCQRLALALERLGDMDREILLLRHYSELPFGEIAGLLGIPLGTALARAHRALAKLKSEMEKDVDT